MPSEEIQIEKNTLQSVRDFVAEEQREQVPTNKRLTASMVLVEGVYKRMLTYIDKRIEKCS